MSLQAIEPILSSYSTTLVLLAFALLCWSCARVVIGEIAYENGVRREDVTDDMLQVSKRRIPYLLLKWVSLCSIGGAVVHMVVLYFMK
ncbi:hypothetical protein [Bacillus thuringiensis]|uniref:hypothetical protein n=1 Tax=Bacillus thuringiensis TaxID=1428 RepID=UPI000BFD6CA8|nr:hypothetical protein [Bacillus thuringiensis]PGT90095.1 hypothetical protein COD17_10115 [Bacillus thuringiensis]